MKKSKLLLCTLGCASLLALTVGLAGCGHKHELEKHDAVTATCKQEGTGEYYTCTGCDKIFNANGEELEKIPTTPKAAHRAASGWSSDENDHWHECTVCHAQINKDAHLASGNWENEGDTHYKVCDTCGYHMYEGTHSYELSVKTPANKLLYYAGDAFDATGLVLRKECAGCGEGEDITTGIEIGYEHGSAVSEGDSKVVATVGDLHVDITISVGGITHITNLTCEDIYCGETPNPSASKNINIASAVIEYTYQLGEHTDGSGTFEAADQLTFTAGTYTVKAHIAKGTGYTEAFAYKTFEVSHHYENTVGEGHDTVACACGDSYDFDTAVSDEMQEFLITANSFNLTMNGVGSYTAITAITYQGYSLVQAESDPNLSSLYVSSDLVADKENHGEHDVVVTVTDSHGFSHDIPVPVCFVTGYIATIEDYAKVFRSTDDISGSKHLDFYGYYKQTANFSHDNSATKGKFHGTYNGGGYKITMGYKSHTYLPGGGLFNYIGDYATIKNVVIDGTYNNVTAPTGDCTNVDQYANMFVIAYGADHVTIENFTFNYVSGIDSDNIFAVEQDTKVAKPKGLLFRHDVTNCTFKNVTINAAGKQLGYVLAAEGVSGNTYENFVINATNIKGFCGTATLAKDPDEFDGVTYNHDHTYANFFDSDYHYVQTCKYCSEGTEGHFDTANGGKKEAHNLGVWQLAEGKHYKECSLCHNHVVEHDADMSSDWTTEGGKHWHACNESGCTYKENEDNCSYVLEVVTPATKLKYEVGETFDTTGLVLQKRCTVCNDIANSSISSGFSVTYQGSGSAFAAGHNKVTVTVDGLSIELRINVGGATSITELAVEALSCGGTPTPSSQNNVGATVVYTYQAGDHTNGSGTFEAADQITFVAGTYTVKAYIAEVTGEYIAATAYATFTVAHNYSASAPTNGVEHMTCACGDEYDFVVVAEGVQELEMTQESFAITLPTQTSGVTYNVTDITATLPVLGTYSFGKNAGALNITAQLKGAKQYHGEYTLSVAVTDNKGATHTISVPVLIVTKYIASNTDLAVAVPNAVVDSYGYYKQTANITYAYTQCTFYGTYDGNGYYITDGDGSGGITYGGMFNKLGAGSMVKNLIFHVKLPDLYSGNGDGRSVIAVSATNSHLKNIVVSVDCGFSSKEYMKGANQCGFLFTRNAADTVFEDVTVCAPGRELGIVLGGNWSHGGNEYKNFTLYAKDVAAFTANNNTDAGLIAPNAISSGLTYVQTGFPNIIAEYKISEGERVAGNRTLALPAVAGATAVSAKFVRDNGAVSDATISGENLTIPVTGLTLGNYYTVMVTYSNGEIKHVPFRYVTMAIYTLSDLNYVRILENNLANPFAGGTTQIKGCFVLMTDFGNESTQTVLSDKGLGGVQITNALNAYSSSNLGFAGTFDGLGHSFINYKFGYHGIFGALQSGSKIENLYVVDAALDNSKRSCIFTFQAGTAVFSNVHVNVIEDNSSAAAAGKFCGVWIGDNMNQYTKFINCTLDIGATTIQSVFGTRAVAGCFTETNFKNFTITRTTGTIVSYYGGYEDIKPLCTTCPSVITLVQPQAQA